MSENNTEQLSTENNFSFSINNGVERVQVKFSDGVRVLPDYVVQGLGGAEKIKEVAAALASVTYQQFMEGFNKTMQRQQLNEFQRKFIGNHFGKLRG